MKLIYLTFLILSLLILSGAQSTEENPSSEDSSPSETPEETQPSEESSNNPESSSPSSEEGDESSHQSSSEPSEDESSPKSGDDQHQDQGKGQDQDSKNGNPEEQPAAAAGAAKGSYLETYNEIGKLLDAVDFKSIDDLHLQRMLENNFQGRLRNPIRSQTGQIANFSAIKSCFEKLGDEMKKLIDDAKKEFDTCKTGDGADSAVCTDQQENKFADGVIALATTMQGCIASQRKD